MPAPIAVPTIGPITAQPARKSSLSIGTIAGWATRYDTLTDDRGGYKMRISAGAFTDSIRTNDRDIRALAQHDETRVIGRLSAGTLQLKDRPNGLWFSIALPDSPLGNEIWVASLRGDLDQMSVGLVMIADGIDWTVEGKGDSKQSVMLVSRAGLQEVSVVTWPAIKAATYAPQTATASKPTAPVVSNQSAHRKGIAAYQELQRSLARLNK